jgi:hypothetical protein
MEYTKQTWTAPTGTGLSRYAKSAESASHVTLTLDPENLTNSPTPFTAERMTHMEDGIAKAYDTAPPTPWAQYSGKDIPMLPDNLAGTTYKRDNDWVDTDGWIGWGAVNTLSIENNMLKVVSTVSGAGIERTIGLYANKTVVIAIESQDDIGDVKFYNGANYVTVPFYKITNKKVIAYFYSSTTHTTFLFRVYNTANTPNTIYVSSLYIGTGAYDRLVFDNSYHYRHLLNNAVVPTQQGLYFNGATSYLRSKDKVTLPDVFTFSATVNCAVKSTGQVLFAQGSFDATPFLWFYRYKGSNTLYIRGSDGTQAIIVQDVLNFFTGLDNTDIEVEATFDFINKTIDLYRNKIKFGSTLSLGTMVKPVSDNIYIGNSVALNNSLLGYMRNICLFDSSLTDTQRNWLAQGNTPPILYDVTNWLALETLRYNASFLLHPYSDGKKLRIANTHASNTITCTLPSGQTMNGQASFTLLAGQIQDLELIGTAWKNMNEEIYSTTEQIIGRWIDGKPIYQKTIDFGALPNNTTKLIQHNITYLKDVVGISGFLLKSDITVCIPNDTTPGLWRDGIYLGISTISDNTQYNGYITLTYTKTTD